MTKDETEAMLRYMLFMYPNVRMTEQQFKLTVQTWYSEFANESTESVGEAMRLARSESPDFIPTVPKIQNAIRSIAARTRIKSSQQEYKDSHCGKSKEEWAKVVNIRNDNEGKSKLEFYKQQFAIIIGGNS